MNLKALNIKKLNVAHDHSTFGFKVYNSFIQLFSIELKNLKVFDYYVLKFKLSFS